MDADRSHDTDGTLTTGNWRITRAAKWIALPVVVALVGGAHLGITAWISASRPAANDRMRELTAQGRAMVEGFWASLDSLRWQTIGLDQIRTTEIASGKAPSLPTGKILHWAEMEIQAAKPGMAELIGPVRQSARNLTRPAGTAGGQGDAVLSDVFFNETYVSMLPSQLSLRELRDNGVSLARIRPDPNRGKELLALAFSPPQARHKIVAALVDPTEAFAYLTRLSPKGDPTGLRAYLITGDGRVIAHSMAAYVGTSFTQVPVFRDAVRGLILGLRVSGAGEYGAIDRLPVTAAYERPGSLPLGVVVERVEAAHGLTLDRAFGAWDRIAGQTSAWLGAILLTILCLLYTSPSPRD